MKKTFSPTLLVIVLGSLLTAACGKKDQEFVNETQPVDVLPSATKTHDLDLQAAETWWSQGGEVLARCLQNARDLQHITSDFLDEPDAQKLEQSQHAWQKTALAYRSFYAYHYLGLSEPQAFHILSEVDYRIAAWPVQPGSLDSFGSYLYSGLVHDIGNPLTMDNLLTLHGQIDSENATLGLFAIEFMLFGEEGTRKVSDYVRQLIVDAEHKERGFNSPSELPNNRRRMLLTLQTGKLVDDLALLVNSWNAPNVTSQAHAWQSLEDSAKYRALSAALEQGLAQLLVNENERQDTAMLKAALDSLRPLPVIIRHRNAEKMADEFDALTQLLAADSDTDTVTNTDADTNTNADTKNSPEASSPDWPAINTRLTTLTKLYAPQTPAIAETEDAPSES